MTELNVITRIERAFREHAERLALSAADGDLSYRELERIVVGITERIGARGTRPPRIGVLTGDDMHTYASLLAIMAVGAAYVPLNRKNPVERNQRVIESAALDLVLAARPGPEIEALETAMPSCFEVLYTEGLRSDQRLRVARVRPDDLVYLFFTSGTTGIPKGVPIRHKNLDAFMGALLGDSSYGFVPEDRFLQMFELTFDLSVMSWLAPLCIGASCHVVPETGIQSLNIVRILDEHDISVALMVPSVLSYLRRYFEELEFPKLRHSLFCGEALSHQLTVEWAACLPSAEIRNVYGPTEATIFCTEFRWQEAPSAEQSVNDIVPIGKPTGATTALVVDESGRAVAQGERGELCLLGAQLAEGYWQDESRSAAVFVELEQGGLRQRAYRTGDICFVNDSGNFVYCGRADAQVQIDGHRVELSEVEHYARAFLDGGNAVAVPVRADDGRQEFVLFLESADELERLAQDHLRSKVPSYMIPKRVISVASFPLNLNGKVDRKDLLGQYLKTL